MSKIKDTLKSHSGLLIFIIIYILFSLITYKNIPITSDEEYRYSRGKEQLNYFLNSKPLQNYFEPSIEPDSYYFYVTLLNILNPKFLYEWFHLQNLIFALIIFVTCYFLVYEYSKNKIISIISLFLLLFTPSFSGHLGFNPVDMPFAILLILNLYLIYKFRNTGFNFYKILALGFSFWLLLGIRPIGFQIFLLYLIFIFLSRPKDGIKTYFLNEIKNLILIGFISVFLLTISWPYLGINFFKHLPEILLTNASYNKWSNLVIFNGNLISYDNRPWEYLFTYLSLTTPLFILLLFFYNLFNPKSLLKKFLLITFFLNLSLYLVIQPVIYNGLRHFLFLLPIIVIMSSFGLSDLLNSQNNKIKFSILTICLFSLIYTIYNVVKLYPLHYAYFNEIAGGTRNNIDLFETDYWGGSYKAAALYIKDNISTDNPYDTKVYSCNVSYAMDYYSHKKFIMTIKREEANYTVCTVLEDKRRNLPGEIVKEIELDGKPFIYIRKLN